MPAPTGLGLWALQAAVDAPPLFRKLVPDVCLGLYGTGRQPSSKVAVAVAGQSCYPSMTPDPWPIMAKHILPHSAFSAGIVYFTSLLNTPSLALLARTEHSPRRTVWSIFQLTRGVFDFGHPNLWLPVYFCRCSKSLAASDRSQLMPNLSCLSQTIKVRKCLSRCCPSGVP